MFSKKKVEEMVEKLDSKSYYYWLVERDKKRVRRLKFLTFEGLKKLVNLLLHLTGIHRLEVKDSIFLDGEAYIIYQCKVCNYKCTDLALKREVVKFSLGYPIILGIGTFLSFLFPSNSQLFFWIFCFITCLHTWAGVIFLLDNASNLVGGK